ncbi:MAG: histidine tRNA synthetase [Harvfovirus sp.]|uniref:histidine--tRNA ligase n=1 Tax=Harvfovirus sp. TaxID=2487768 RepID=A0A3G5A040_9VIRU|nr:MAG: histidine tRNA synthetase [Harvfovirus sp.]
MTSDAVGDESTRILRRVATGMRDWDKTMIALREHIINVCKKYYTATGACQLDTPVLELFEMVKNIYGEEFDKSVYLLDEGDLIMRYDLTVPFVRYVTMNCLKLFRRYQIGKVYRRDRPELSKGRYCEITQADFDIAGSDQGSGIFDLEILQLVQNLLTELIGDNFIVRLNNRSILQEYLEKMNVPKEMLLTVAATIDKLDKKSLEEICVELKEKGVEDKVIGTIQGFIGAISKILNSSDKIMAFLEKELEEKIFGKVSDGYEMKSVRDICLELKEYGTHPTIIAKVRKVDNMHKISVAGVILEYLKTEKLISDETFLKESNFFNRIVKLGIGGVMFDPLLTRGLDYYTALIFEVYYNDREIMPSSICAGGRYDDLIGKFTAHGSCPAVGMSVGVERIVTILSELKIPERSEIKIYVASIGSKEKEMEILDARIMLCNEFRKHNIPTAMSHLKNPKMGSQMEEILSNNIPYMVVIGSSELKSNTIGIKNIAESLPQQKFEREAGIKFLVEKLK